LRADTGRPGSRRGSLWRFVVFRPGQVDWLCGACHGGLSAHSFSGSERGQAHPCGPMSGFDNAKVDAAFFAGTTVKSNFLCNLGYGDASKLYPRSPRLDFEEACKLV
jgi:hypothetical protein